MAYFATLSLLSLRTSEQKAVGLYWGWKFIPGILDNPRSPSIEVNDTSWMAQVYKFRSGHFTVAAGCRSRRVDVPH